MELFYDSRVILQRITFKDARQKPSACFNCFPLFFGRGRLIEVLMR